MANLKEIRSRIKSVKTTQQMTSAMKMVAAAKLRRAQDQILQLRPYASKLKEVMGNVLATLEQEAVQSPFTRENTSPENILLVVVTSNRGLCGAFNSGVLKYGLQVATEEYAAQHENGNVAVLCIGKKAYEFYKRRNIPLIGENNDVFTDLSFATVEEVVTPVMEEFKAGKWDRVELIYNQFKNVVVQKRTREQFLPLQLNSDVLADTSVSEYIFEPNQEEILSELIPKSLKLQFYKAVLESNAGEQGARMTAMDKATENAEELLRELRLTYNRARQAAITTEILEIVAGAEALSAG